MTGKKRGNLLWFFSEIWCNIYSSCRLAFDYKDKPSPSFKKKLAYGSNLEDQKCAHMAQPPPPAMEKFKRVCGLRQGPSFFSSHTLTQSKNSPNPACSCIYAWSALPLVPSAHFIIHTYSTVATGNATISASTALLHFISMSDRSVLRSGYSKLPHHLKWTYT